MMSLGTGSMSSPIVISEDEDDDLPKSTQQDSVLPRREERPVNKTHKDSKGHDMMLGMGYVPGHGLGRQLDGEVEPLPVVLKRKRAESGVGCHAPHSPVPGPSNINNTPKPSARGGQSINGQGMENRPKPATVSRKKAKYEPEWQTAAEKIARNFSSTSMSPAPAVNPLPLANMPTHSGPFWPKPGLRSYPTPLCPFNCHNPACLCRTLATGSNPTPLYHNTTPLFTTVFSNPSFQAPAWLHGYFPAIEPTQPQDVSHFPLQQSEDYDHPMPLQSVFQQTATTSSHKASGNQDVSHFPLQRSEDYNHPTPLQSVFPQTATTSSHKTSGNYSQSSNDTFASAGTSANAIPVSNSKARAASLLDQAKAKTKPSKSLELPKFKKAVLPIGMAPPPNPQSDHGQFTPASDTALYPVASRTLVMETIPRNFRSLDFVEQWYKTVTKNGPDPVRIEFSKGSEKAKGIRKKVGGKALIEFPSAKMAMEAWKSPRLAGGKNGTGLEGVRVWWYRVKWVGVEAGAGELEEGEIGMEDGVGEGEGQVEGTKNTKESGVGDAISREVEKQRKNEEKSAWKASRKPTEEEVLKHSPQSGSSRYMDGRGVDGRELSRSWTPNPYLGGSRHSISSMIKSPSISSVSRHVEIGSDQTQGMNNWALLEQESMDLETDGSRSPSVSRGVGVWVDDLEKHGGGETLAVLHDGDHCDSVASLRPASPKPREDILDASTHIGDNVDDLELGYPPFGEDNEVCGEMNSRFEDERGKSQSSSSTFTASTSTLRASASPFEPLRIPVASRSLEDLHQISQTPSPPVSSHQEQEQEHVSSVLPILAPMPKLAQTASMPVLPSQGGTSVGSNALKVHSLLTPPSSTSTPTPPLEPRAMANAPKGPSYTKRALMAKHKDSDVVSDQASKIAKEETLRRLVLESRKNKVANGHLGVAETGQTLQAVIDVDDTASGGVGLGLASAVVAEDSRSDSSVTAVVPQATAESSLDSYKQSSKVALDDLAISFINETIQTMGSSSAFTSSTVSTHASAVPALLQDTEKRTTREANSLSAAPSVSASKEKSGLAARQKMLEDHITSTKLLMSKLETARTKQEKDSILGLLRERNRLMEEQIKAPFVTAAKNQEHSKATAGRQPFLRAQSLRWPEVSQDAGILTVSDDEDEDEDEEE